MDDAHLHVQEFRVLPILFAKRDSVEKIAVTAFDAEMTAFVRTVSASPTAAPV